MQVPTQSFPVSPPPTIITSLPFADMWFPSSSPPSSRAFVVDFRKSTAKYTPSASRPSTLRSRGVPEPQHRTTASYSEVSSFAFSPSTRHPVTKPTPSSSISFIRRRTIFLSSFMFGIPYIRSPPGRSELSKTVTECPRRFSISAQASPEGPEPTTATRFPERISGILGFIRPFSKPFSIM